MSKKFWNAVVLILSLSAPVIAFSASMESARAADGNKLGESIAKNTILAEAGVSEAASWLGHLYFHGFQGVHQNSDLAVKYLSLAAEGGDANAQITLATIYYEGTDVPKDVPLASKFLEAAAAQGGAKAQYLLWSFLEDHPELEAHGTRATWLMRAAAQNHTDAQASLGNAYLYGDGVRQDFEEGARWAKKAASKNDRRGQRILALAHILLGDSVQAYAWINLAAASGAIKRDAEIRDRLGAVLTAQQLNEAQRLSREYDNEIRGHDSAMPRDGT